MILPAKRLLQKLCREDLGWDNVIMIRSDHLERWCEWTRGITGLSDVKVPRCVKPQHLYKVDSIQLHYFSDASEEGYKVLFLTSVWLIRKVTSPAVFYWAKQESPR